MIGQALEDETIASLPAAGMEAKAHSYGRGGIRRLKATRMYQACYSNLMYEFPGTLIAGSDVRWTSI